MRAYCFNLRKWMEKKKIMTSAMNGRQILEVPWCRNKCFPKRNLNSCNIDASLTFKFWNICRITF